MEEIRQPANILGNAPIPMLVAKFALPSVVSMLVNSLYNIVDQIFIGQGVGYLGNAATNIVFPITIIVMAFTLMIGDGATAHMSICLGKGNRSQAERGVGNAITLLLIVSAAATIAALVFLQPICRFFGATQNTLPYAMEYGRVIVMGFPFFVLGAGINSFIRADGNPGRAMLAMLVGAVTNVILDPLFIFVFRWGVTGAAIATVIGQALTFLIAITCLPRFKHITITKQRLKPNASVCRTICGYGMSSFITQIAITVGIFVLNNSIVTYGALSRYGPDIPLAAFGIVMKVNQVLSSIVLGIAVGAQPIWGFNYGAQRYERVRKAYGIAILCALIVTAAGLIVFQFFPQYIVNLFGQESALYHEFALLCFRIFLMFCMMNGFQLCTGVFFQAIGKPLKATFITMSRQLIGLIPALLILPRFFGIYGVLWSAPVADCAAFIMALAFAINELKHLSKAMNEITNSPTGTQINVPAEK